MSVDLRNLIKNGVHFGHQTARWNPKMEPYIWGSKNGIHLIDVSKTAHQLEQASKFLETVAGDGRTILVVGTKKAAQPAIEKLATELGLPYVVHRWVGGTFSNFRQVRKAISNMLHFEDILAKSDQFPYNKKELNTLKKRVGRLNNIVGGIRNLSWPVGAVVVVDVKKEYVCVKEAAAMGIPVVGIVDTNSDPDGVTYVIPANDDAPRSIITLVEYIGEAIKRGQEIAKTKPKDQLPLAENYEAGGYEGYGLESEEDEEKKRGVRRRRPVGGGAAARPAGRGGQRSHERGPRPEGHRAEGPAKAAAPAQAAAEKPVVPESAHAATEAAAQE